VCVRNNLIKTKLNCCDISKTKVRDMTSNMDYTSNVALYVSYINIFKKFNKD